MDNPEASHQPADQDDCYGSPPPHNEAVSFRCPDARELGAQLGESSQATVNKFEHSIEGRDPEAFWAKIAAQSRTDERVAASPAITYEYDDLSDMKTERR